MRHHLAAVLFVLMSGQSAAAADVRIVIANGTVSVSATDATLRDILTEWERVGRTAFANLDRLDGARTTIELVNVTEADALDILLRHIRGYLAVPRSQPLDGPSKYARIVLVPGGASLSASALQATPAPDAHRSASNANVTGDRVSVLVDDDDPAPQPSAGQRLPGQPVVRQDEPSLRAVPTADDDQAAQAIGVRAGAPVFSPSGPTATSPSLSAPPTAGVPTPGMPVAVPEPPISTGFRVASTP